MGGTISSSAKIMMRARTLRALGAVNAVVIRLPSASPSALPQV